MTHVKTPEDLLPLTGEVNNLLGDIGSVQAYDFSKANSSYEARVAAVTKIASVCYANPKALNSISLFDRLEAESHGLPSSSYEFVPILIDLQDAVRYKNHIIDITVSSDSYKYGERIDSQYLLTNLRAVIADVGAENSLLFLNTSEEEQQIIRDNFKVFLYNVDLPTRSQMERHRISWQELSRRYVSGKKQPFDFYISEKMTTIESNEFDYYNSAFDTYMKDTFSTKALIDLCINHYNAAITSGVKPEEARRILPQAMMTTVWGAWQPNQLDNFFQLRLDKHAQKEIQQVAQAMKDLL